MEEKVKIPKRYWIVGGVVIIPIVVLCGFLFAFGADLIFYIFALLSLSLCLYLGNFGQWLVFHKVQNKTVVNCILPMVSLSFLKILPYLAFITICIVQSISFNFDVNSAPVLLFIAGIFLLATVWILFNDYRRYYSKFKKRKIA